MKAGHALYFLADKVCHRAPPPQLQGVGVQQPNRRRQGRQSSSQLLEEDGLSNYVHGLDGKRRVLFWFSWDDAVARDQQSTNEPELDFQLNPWTLHHLIFKGDSYADDQVLGSFFISHSFFLFRGFFGNKYFFFFFIRMQHFSS